MHDLIQVPRPAYDGDDFIARERISSKRLDELDQSLVAGQQSSWEWSPVTNDSNPRVLNTTLPSSQGLTQMGMGDVVKKILAQPHAF